MEDFEISALLDIDAAVLDLTLADFDVDAAVNELGDIDLTLADFDIESVLLELGELDLTMDCDLSEEELAAIDALLEMPQFNIEKSTLSEQEFLMETGSFDIW